MPATLTYNFGGAAAGIDYRFDPRFLVGIGVGYTHGTQWVNTFLGQGWTDSRERRGLRLVHASRGFYVDALAGYAYFNNQLQRQIVIPGLQQRTASGSTGANQFLGQVEGGYKIGVYAPAAGHHHAVRPLPDLERDAERLHRSRARNSLSLNVAQQTTNSQRTTIGADLASSIGLGNERKLDLALRLGWMHEFADTGRPITAAFAGAPGNSFTVFGATPLRNAAVVGFQATTTIAAATQIYLRFRRPARLGQPTQPRLHRGTAAPAGRRDGEPGGGGVSSLRGGKQRAGSPRKRPAAIARSGRGR